MEQKIMGYYDTPNQIYAYVKNLNEQLKNENWYAVVTQKNIKIVDLKLKPEHEIHGNAKFYISPIEGAKETCALAVNVFGTGKETIENKLRDAGFSTHPEQTFHKYSKNDMSAIVTAEQIMPTLKSIEEALKK